MAILSDLLTLLRRPTKPPPAAELPAKGRGKAPVPVPAEELPVTEAELIEALARIDAEANAAHAMLTDAAERRERLLLEPGSDDAILAIGRDVDAANLTLERLERLAPQVQARLQELRNIRLVSRWHELRDAYLAAGRAVYEAALRFNAEHVPPCTAALAALQAEFPAAVVGSPGQLGFVPAFPFIAPGNLAGFDAAMARLSITAPDPWRRPPPLIQPVEALGEEGSNRLFGAPPAKVERLEPEQEEPQPAARPSPSLHDTIGAPPGLWGDRSHRRVL